MATALGARLGAVSRPLFDNPQGWRGLMIGLLLGFLPCGLLYAAIGAAVASSDPLIAAMGMAVFTLGTFPTLWVIAYLGATAQRRWGRLGAQGNAGGRCIQCRRARLDGLALAWPVTARD